MTNNTNTIYNGAEIGPIRPPSEATSLMLRVTRNCPWNKCTFCTLYKGENFSIRKRAHVIDDIDAIAYFINRIEEINQLSDSERTSALQKLRLEMSTEKNVGAAESALHWYSYGCRSVFLQDANTMLAKTDDLAAILHHLRETFPKVERITSYARSKTIVDKSDEDLLVLRNEGLDRVHIGMESGSDRVLDFVKKGATKDIHVEAGKKIKKAGIELSEYYIVGLGGKEMSAEHAKETADALNKINPDFIRIRTLSVPGRALLAEDVRAGRFTMQNDIECAEELLLFLENLDVTSYLICNDHIVNLLPDASGSLPEDKEMMIDVVKWFLNLSEEDQMIYRIGRRSARINGRRDMENPATIAWAKNYIAQNGINKDNIDAMIHQTMKRFL